MVGRLLVVAAGAALVVTALAGASTNFRLVRLSVDPYTNTTSQHKTEVEPDTYAFGSTMVVTHQTGRFSSGGSSNLGFVTTTDGGATWTNGFLPGTTKYATPPGPYDRISDPSVAYDAKHGIWIISGLAISESGGVHGVAVTASRSLDGGLTWQNPVTVATGSFPDKNWIACDNTPASPFYGNCYTEWDDAGAGGFIHMNTSSDGGATWGPTRNTGDNATGLGGQPLVRPNGTVVVPINSDSVADVAYFQSTDGGATWSGMKAISNITAHSSQGGLRIPDLVSAEIDKRGRVFVAWYDCRFRTSCSSNDIVYAIVKPSGAVSAVNRVPIDPTTSTVDHFTPGIAVDPTTGGAGTHIAVTYYYLPVAACGSTCDLDVGFISSTDGGATWSTATQLAGPMKPSWLPTAGGRMFGDYISTSFVEGKAFPGIIVAQAPTQKYHVSAYSVKPGFLEPLGGDVVANEAPVPGAVPDHPSYGRPLTAN
jgi:hypothetical protein